MTVATKIGVGGAWKAVKGISVGVGGAWKTVKAVWIGVGGVWKQVYDSGFELVAVAVSAGSFGYTSSGYGSLTPSYLTGTLILTLVSDTNITLTTLALSGQHPRDYFNSLEVNYTGQLLTATSDSFDNAGTNSIWQWSAAPISAVGTYTVTFT